VGCGDTGVVGGGVTGGTEGGGTGGRGFTGVLPVPGPVSGRGGAADPPLTVPTGAGPVMTPGVTTTGGFAGSGADGIVPTVGAGLATGLGVPYRRAEVSVTPAASGGGLVGFAGPGAVDSPITGPMTRG
jgi:hypothetical protein